MTQISLFIDKSVPTQYLEKQVTPRNDIPASWEHFPT